MTYRPETGLSTMVIHTIVICVVVFVIWRLADPKPERTKEFVLNCWKHYTGEISTGEYTTGMTWEEYKSQPDFKRGPYDAAWWPEAAEEEANRFVPVHVSPFPEIRVLPYTTTGMDAARTGT